MSSDKLSDKLSVKLVLRKRFLLLRVNNNVVSLLKRRMQSVNNNVLSSNESIVQ